MILTEKHIIKYNHSFYNECDSLCFLSKNLYNSGLYNIRQHYFNTKSYLNYNDNYHLLKLSKDYTSLPTKVSCQIIKKIDTNFKSFFSLLKRKDINNKIPNYLDKVNGRYITIFPKQSLGLKEFKKTGKIMLSQTNIKINTKVKDFNVIKEVRIIPRIRHYVIEVVYEKNVKISNGKYIASIDGGINNLATVAITNKRHFIINGKPLKSINQYFNKQKSKIQSELILKNKRKKSKRLDKLTHKRNNKVNDYLHKASRVLVNQLVSNEVKTLVIGKNKNMKQDINIGRVNNQNFVNIPLFKFFNIVKYKCEIEGINVIVTEESYTSKCSFLDNEVIKKHDNYLGKRIKRGLFRTAKGCLINSDLNGSLNILKKAVPNAFGNGIEGLGVNPMVIKL